MRECLPKQIDPALMARKQARLVGDVPVACCARLLELAPETGGSIHVELAFGKEQGVLRVRGWVGAVVRLECQSCLGPMDQPVRCEVNLGVVSSLDEADRLPSGVDPWLWDGAELLPLSELVEDEVILALPLIPRHTDCGSEQAMSPLD